MTGDRLSVLDNSFLELEQGPSHMHVGALLVFDGPPLDCADFLEHTRRRLHLVPRYRQKVLTPPMDLGRPMWVDDPCFNLDYHVRHTSLPRPGTQEQLTKLVARVFSQRLDRTKPLWEMWLVDGLEDDRFAIISKAHHALIDGMSGVDLISVLFDLTPDPPEAQQPEPWEPQPLPPTTRVVAEGAREVALGPARLARRALRSVREPARAVEGALGISQLLGPPVVSPAPRSPMNTSIGPHRRVRWVPVELDAVKQVKDELGGTVNDVVVTAVAGAVRRWLLHRGAPADRELRAMVPVSVRTEDQRHTLGNRVAAMRAPLPVHVEHPVARLEAVRSAMTGLKESKQAVGAEALTGLQDFAPPTLLAQAARINFSTRLFNVIVTNVPGPQFPLYVLGRRMAEIVPFAFLPKDHALAFAVMSYHGGLRFGLLGDYDALDDLDVVAAALEASLAELIEAAGGSPPRSGRFDRAAAESRRAVR
ncbi:wax ester/triacylglycerol synthase family O-acyltransferase [Conexibacter sp. SYSU D00693]|uniref:WS/DGAT/MGAT family O-acyltransferase n=1 Tax=Conexibacter sp. SYSU D00693 TaxID=2812560 RepID=UPI00196A7053|nr:wax ester/triacylglycerol synthase family O-acyltransferase [Conexibacter sp. SYSU D00693]